MKTLDKADVGKWCEIVAFEGDFDKVSRRFFELGFLIGEKVKILSTSLQKKVFLLQLRGAVLSVRANLLKRIVVR